MIRRLIGRQNQHGLAGCADKILKKLGWKPAGTFRELVREMVEAELAAIDSRD
jgi:GDP-D-mannose dehydratase